MDALAARAFEHAPIGMIYTEARTIRWVNPRFCEIFRASRDEVTDQPLSICYPSELEYERIGAFVPRLMRRTGRFSDERIMKRLSGSLFWCQVRGQSLNHKEPFAHAVWTFADLADIRPKASLTPREIQVAMLTAEGRCSKEIGRALNISHRTVEAHKLKLFRKMNVQSGPELIARLTGMLGQGKTAI